jgi:hypothetical protein
MRIIRKVGKLGDFYYLRSKQLPTVAYIEYSIDKYIIGFKPCANNIWIAREIECIYTLLNQKNQGDIIKLDSDDFPTITGLSNAFLKRKDLPK